MNQFIAIILIVFTSICFTQNQPILPAQKNAIQALASENGYSNEGLNSFLIEKYKQKKDPLLLSFISQIVELFYNELCLNNINNYSIFFYNKIKILKKIY